MNNTETIVLGGGCFWCTEALYQNIRGVLDVTSGYAGGRVKNPSYDEICSGETGHAEVVQITFDTSIISLADILYFFFRIHDPTTVNRQGADVGSQYRSIILYSSDEQRVAAEQSIVQVENERLYAQAVVTEIKPLAEFYPAENYHQDYFKRNGNQPYCMMVINPKIQKMKKQFQDKELISV